MRLVGKRTMIARHRITEQRSDRCEPSSQAGGDEARGRPYVIAFFVGLVCPIAVSWGFCALEDYLLTRRLLNTRDLGFVGGEKGTVFEYLTNVWYWDAAGMVLLLAAWASCIVTAAALLAGRRKDRALAGARHEPVQFSLRGVFLFVTGCCLLFAAAVRLGFGVVAVALPLAVVALGGLLNRPLCVALGPRGAAMQGAHKGDSHTRGDQ